MRLFLALHLLGAAAAAAVTPPDKSILPLLTSTTFNDTIADGRWFVKFFSPSCPHCNKLAPFWEAAGEKYKDLATSDNFHLASVDCQVQGDLCHSRKIKAYPTLYLYKDGEKIDEWVNVGGKDPLKPISEFIEKHVAEPTSTTGSDTNVDSIPAKTTGVSKAKTDEEESSPREAKPLRDSDFNYEPKPKPAVPLKSSDFGSSDETKAKSDSPPNQKSESPEAKARIGSAVKAPATDGDKKQVPFSNPSGSSVKLTAETFTKLVTSTQDPWFIKFFAPWCGHCRAMAPAWTELASEYKDKMNVGEVDCEAEARLCADVKIHGYPTLLFFKGEKHIEYSGLRGVGDLIAFAKKAVNAGIKDVDSGEFEIIHKNEEVVFLYFYDDATTSEDFEALERTSLELIGHSPLLKTSSSILANRFRATTFPKLTVIRDGKPQYYPALGPADMRDHTKMLAWMKTAWLPIVPELSAENSHEIMQNRLVVLATLDPESASFDSQRALVKEAAHEFTDKRAAEEQAEKQALRDKKQIKIDAAEKKGDPKAVESAKNIRVKLSDHQEVGFAWVNGIFWEKWLAVSYQINVARDGAKIIIYDEDQKRYWDKDLKGNKIPFTKQGILDTITAIALNPSKIKSKSTKNSLEAAYYAARQAGTGHPWAFVGFGVLSVVVAGFAYMRRSKKIHMNGFTDREKGGHFAGNGKYD